MLLDLLAPLNRLRAILRPAPVCPPSLPDVLCPLLHPQAPLPTWVAADPVVQKYRVLLGDLPWADFPERPTARPWPGPQPQPRAPLVAAYLVKLHEGKRSIGSASTACPIRLRRTASTSPPASPNGATSPPSCATYPIRRCSSCSTPVSSCCARPCPWTSRPPSATPSPATPRPFSPGCAKTTRRSPPCTVRTARA